MFAVPAADSIDIRSLYWISRFGWLRLRELSHIIWPSPLSKSGKELELERADDARRKSISRYAGRWHTKKWVIHRQLPDGAGIALVLSKAGARHLARTINIPVRAGDNWGRAEEGRWAPPASWKHDLFTTGLLLEYADRGAEFKTELELRTENPRLAKYPDALIQFAASDQSGQERQCVHWLEVESAEKTGRKMLALASALTVVSRGLAPELSGWKATHAAVAFRVGQRDKRGRPIDHQHRVSLAVSKHLGASIRLLFVEVTVMDRAHHLVDLHQTPAVIDPVDLNSPNGAPSSSLFHSNTVGHFERVVVDRRGDHWLMKVSPAKEGRFWGEIFHAGERKEGFIVPNLEYGLRHVQQVWTERYW